MQSYDESLQTISRYRLELTTGMVSISRAIGHITSEPLYAPISVPSFDNSAMDGFAFEAKTTADASDTNPIHVSVSGSSIAGDNAKTAYVPKGQATKIMTGAPLPTGADTILPVEAASWDHKELVFDRPYPQHRHVRKEGEDFEKSNILLASGTKIGPRHIPLLCTAGLNQVPIYQKPKANWISTGQEISDDFDQPLAPGQIYNATQIYGQVIAQDMGLDLQESVTVQDTAMDFGVALEQSIATQTDIILSTGGVSAGQYDFVKPVLLDLGAEIILHKARIKPGKPVLFARLPNGAFFFGLPGNPISTALALRAFVYPLVRQSLILTSQIFTSARLTTSIEKRPTRTVFLMGNITSCSNGQNMVSVHTSQQSFQTKPFAESNCWVVIPEGDGVIEKGQTVHCLPL